MLTGVPIEVHGIDWNEARPGFVAVPTLLSLARARGLRTVMVVGKEKLRQLSPPGACDVFALHAEGDAEVVTRAASEARRGFDLMFVHLPNVDIAGHLHGWMSEAYLAEVVAADAAVSRLLAALPADVNVVVSADHGGHGFGHGEDLETDTKIPWIAAGPAFRSGHVIAQPISTVDTAATAASLLGVSLRADATGRPVREAFLPSP
jgi:predicted AlkP superfamily pyrophosphatase or phosphodiesterase